MASNLLENELEDILNQMGQHVETQAQLHMLKGEIERYLAEEPYMSSDDDELTNQDVLNGSLFASLSIDPAAQFLRRQQVAQEAIQSPIISRRRRGKHSEYENVEFPDDGGDESFDEYPEAKSLINQAYQTIGRVYNTCRDTAGFLDNASVPSESRDEQETIYDEDENEDVVDEENSVSAQSEALAPPQVIVDPSVRPVLSPKPGRAPFKFDPVTRYHLYK
uniref:Uncharacterized protein n=1 Tax=Caenorhabditis japonica TaxID=281687 RepID=A0A8R1DGW0_CAEJA